MVIDTRIHSKNDLLSKFAIFNKNIVQEGGYRPITLIGKQNTLLGKKTRTLNLINYTEGSIGGDKSNGLNFFDYTKGNVGGDKSNVINLFDYVRGNIKEDKINGLNLFDYVRGSIGGNSEDLLGFISIAGKVKGEQKGSAIEIQTRNKKAYQSKNLIRYNPLEKVGFGSSVWYKIDKAEKYFDRLKDTSDYKNILKTFSDYGGSLTKRITSHYTFKDALARQAKKRLSKLEKK